MKKYNIIISYIFSTILCLTIITFSSLSFAQEVKESNDDLLRTSLRKCSQITKYMSRLACYDKTISHFKIDADETEVLDSNLETGLWTIKKDNSKSGELAYIYMNLEANNHTRLNSGKIINPILVIKCHIMEKPEAYVTWGSDVRTPINLVTQHFNTSEAKSLRWILSYDRKATFHPSPLRFIKDILGNTNLRLMITPLREDLIIADFSLKGFNNVISHVKEDCGW